VLANLLNSIVRARSYQMIASKFREHRRPQHQPIFGARSDPCVLRWYAAIYTTFDFLKPEAGRIDHGESVFSVNEPIVDAVVLLPSTLTTDLYIYIGPRRCNTLSF
jgi:hypothetical protein